MLESEPTDKTRSSTSLSATKYNRPLIHLHPRPFRQTAISKHLKWNSETEFMNSLKKPALQPISTSWSKSDRSNFTTSTQMSKFPRYNPAFVQWPREQMIPKGITSVTEKRLLARAEALNQLSQTGISAAQSLPRINESVPLQLRSNNMSYNKGPWTRATASEPTLITQNRGAANVKYRLAAKAPINFTSGNQGGSSAVNPIVTGRLPSRSSTATDFAWYRNSMVSDIWK